MLDRDAQQALERAFATAIKASMNLPTVDERLYFIGKHLMAQYNKTALPQGSREPPHPVNASELRHIGETLTRVLNDTLGSHGWPLAAVANSLLTNGAGGSANGRVVDGSNGVRKSALPTWWTAAAVDVSRIPQPRSRSRSQMQPGTVPLAAGEPGSIPLRLASAANAVTASKVPAWWGSSQSILSSTPKLPLSTTAVPTAPPPAAPLPATSPPRFVSYATPAATQFSKPFVSYATAVVVPAKQQLEQRPRGTSKPVALAAIDAADGMLKRGNLPLWWNQAAAAQVGVSK